MLEINEKAPDFCLKNQDDENVCLDDFKGKWKVVYFYPKDNTPGCSLEARNFTVAADEFKENNASIIGISPDSVNSHKNFCEKNNLNITLLSDPEHKILKKSYAFLHPLKTRRFRL